MPVHLTFVTECLVMALMVFVPTTVGISFGVLGLRGSARNGMTAYTIIGMVCSVFGVFAFIALTWIGLALNFGWNA
jgi:hypothetical protein